METVQMKLDFSDYLEASHIFLEVDKELDNMLIGGQVL